MAARAGWRLASISAIPISRLPKLCLQLVLLDLEPLDQLFQLVFFVSELLFFEREAPMSPAAATSGLRGQTLVAIRN